MAKVESLGIKRLECVHYYVHDLARSRRFYTELFDFAETGESGPQLTERGRQKSAVFEAGNVRIVASQPTGQGGRAWRYLRHHPAGIGTLVFEVRDIEHTFRVLTSRGGTPIDEIFREKTPEGEIAMFSITTPFGSTTFRFVERRGSYPLYPGFRKFESARGGRNRHAFIGFDHVTTNFQTMAPALLWMEHVCGFEKFWDIEFHTNDVRINDKRGSGLRSIVMHDPESGVKFANNEPMRPFFKDSQINLFFEDHHGDGVQHAAISVKDIISAVRTLRSSGVEFMPTSGAYYDALPDRIKKSGIGAIDEDISTLRDLEILVDGGAPKSYLLQIFLKEAAGLYRDPNAGPFFFEIIQRKGDQGFGGGNFRALFESIERNQKDEGRI